MRSRSRRLAVIVVVALLSLLLAATPAAQAENLILPTDQDSYEVTVEFVAAEAAFVDDVYLVGWPDQLLFNTAKTRLGATSWTNTFPGGTELEFRLLARTADPDVTYTWYSDPAKNADGDHVRTTKIDDETYLMAWEDKPLAEDDDFDDAVMVVHIGGDRDGDGLWDRWEENGVDVDYDGTIDLPIHTGPEPANPDRIDVYLEIDWMESASLSHKPKPAAITLLKQAFADAPVDNPDNSTGITLHVDLSDGGNAVPFQEFLRFPNQDGTPLPADVGNFDDVKRANFDPVRRSVYHYCLFAHSLKIYPQQPSGQAERPGNDLIVSFGDWHTGKGDIDGDGLSDEDVGTVMEQAGTLMHELGHNFQLQHGGGWDTNNKPNYLSVMNYQFQHTGIPLQSGGHRLDYSRDDLPNLQEGDLDENLGIQDGAVYTRFYDQNGRQRGCEWCKDPSGQPELVSGNGPIDWLWDGVTQGQSVGSPNVQDVDLNHDGDIGELRGFEDWPVLTYRFTRATDYEDGVHASVDHAEVGYETATWRNSPPVADAGPDRYVTANGACGRDVTLDGSRSSDVDSTAGTNDDILDFRWYESGTLLGQGESLTYGFGLGTHTVTLEVSDLYEDVDRDEVVVVVEDVTPPVVVPSVDESSLWPPDHKMVDVGFTFTVSDNCDLAPEVALEITSDEPTSSASDAGGPQHAPDALAGVDHSVLLRAERSGDGDGRVYVIVLQVVDSSGNGASSAMPVAVNLNRNDPAIDSGQMFDATELN